MAESAAVEFDFDRAQALLNSATTDTDKINRKFIDGDHWQESAGWIGPMPQPGSVGYEETITLLQRAFTSANKMLEVCERHAEGVVGREPRWALVPKDALADTQSADDAVAGENEAQDGEATIIDEAETYLTKWWNDKRVHQRLIDATTTLMAMRRSTLRLYIPAAYLDALGSVKAKTFEDALDAIYVDTPLPEESMVYVDSLTKREYGIFRYKDDEDKTWVEIVKLEETEAEPDVINTIITQTNGEETKDYPLQFGGRITMHEMTRAPFLTPQIQQNQRALNLALSVIPRNVTTSGFLERILLNAQMPGTWETDPATQERKRFIPGNFRTGAGITSFVQGTEVVDSQGNTTQLTPDVRFRDPTDPTPIRDAAQEHYTRILEEADQSHVLINQSATTSGISRVEARADFKQSLKRTQSTVENAGRWLIEAALAVAEAIMGTPGKYTSKLRADFTCRLYLGQISVDERAQNNLEVDAGLMPREYAMSENGIDDVDAAIAIMNSQPDAMLKVKAKRAEILKLLTEAGADLATAAQIAGFPEEEVALFRTSMETITAETDPTGDEADGSEEEGDDPEPEVPPTDA